MSLYTSQDFKTKKALKDAIAAGAKISVYQTGMFGGNEPTEGRVSLEGPHFPKPHTWYGTGVLKDGYLIKVT